MDEFPFMHPEGAPGSMQQMLGDAGFKSMLECQEATASANAQVGLATAAVGFAQAHRTEAVAAFIHMMMFVVFVTWLPVLWWLIRWAM